jgi:glycosyltransferase involved in cell wall biosynthesis
MKSNSDTTKRRYLRPDISFVMPCYNEEEIIGYTIPKMLSAFENAGHNLELIAVDNGSIDRTGEIIKEFAKANPSVVHHRIDKNEGYGNGLLSGLELCSAPWVGMIPADGQVDAEDVVRLFEAVSITGGGVVGKVRRRFRMDGILRKIVSVSYNVFVRILWPSLPSIDINGNPKILPNDVIQTMNLTSRGWFVDPEIMIKAHYMGLRVLEFNVFARMRGNGLSHVRPAACWEFIRNLLYFRFSRELSAWKRHHKNAARTYKHPPVAA